MSASLPRPLFDDFESAGVLHALRRGLALAAPHGAPALDALPAWLLAEPLEEAAAALAPRWSLRTCGRLAPLCRALRVAEVAARGAALASVRAAAELEKPFEFDDAFSEARAPHGADSVAAAQRCVVVHLRLQAGAAAEAALAAEAARCALPGDRPARADERARLGRLHADAHLVAVWVDAHAAYVDQLQHGLDEPAPPSLHTVESAATELDLTDLLQRRTCAKHCPRDALPLLNLCCRATNPGSRGWNNLLEEALETSAPTRLVLLRALAICLTGAHPILHPALRPSWPQRLRVRRGLVQHLHGAGVRAQLVQSAAYVKDVVRRLLATTMAAAPATLGALRAQAHPVATLVSPPMQLFPPTNSKPGLRASVVGFVFAGVRLLRFGKTLAATLQTTFEELSAPGGIAGLRWDSAWLGKGGPALNSSMPATAVVADLWSAAFRAHFLPLWGHCVSRQVRCARLDAPLYRAVAEKNVATKLAAALPRAEALRVQRDALECISAGILSLKDAAVRLGIDDVAGTASNGGTKTATEALDALSAAGAVNMARLLNFARAASVTEELLVVQLGARTAGLQALALHRRLNTGLALRGAPESLDAAAACAVLPKHATTLHVCMECRRVANAHVPDAGRNADGFSETGVSSSMTCLACGPAHLRCAKRSSAALRTALQLEGEHTALQVETYEVDVKAVCDALVNSTSNTSNQCAARVRRDSKSALEQRETALACGDAAMLQVPLLGRVVRVFGNPYALCSFCGAVHRVVPGARVGGELACMRCDAGLLRLPKPAPADETNVACAFCKKVDPMGTGVRWKVVKAPLDQSAENRLRPAPLRTLAFCPVHFKPWIPTALRALSTRQILSHVAFGAKPLFGAEAGRREPDADLLDVEAPKRAGRRLPKKRKARV